MGGKFVADQQLIHAFAQGDEGAANELTRRYYPRVLNLCRSVLRVGDESQDTAQEVFLNVLARKKILAFRGEGKLWTWLYRVTVNACYQHLRQQLVQSLRMVLYDSTTDLPEEWFPSHLSHPEDQYALQDELEILIKMIYRLEAKYRDSLVLVYLRGYTYAQAAKELHLRLTTLGVHLNRAKRKMAQWMRRINLERTSRHAMRTPQRAWELNAAAKGV